MTVQGVELERQREERPGVRSIVAIEGDTERVDAIGAMDEALDRE